MCSPVGRSTHFCSVLFKVSLHDLRGVNRRLAWQVYNRDLYIYKDDINVIYELLSVKHGDLELDRLRLDAFIAFYVLISFL